MTLPKLLNDVNLDEIDKELPWFVTPRVYQLAGLPDKEKPNTVTDSLNTTNVLLTQPNLPFREHNGIISSAKQANNQAIITAPLTLGSSDGNQIVAQIPQQIIQVLKK